MPELEPSGASEEAARESILYLPDADVAGLGIDLDDLRDAVASAFASKARGASGASEKSTVVVGTGHIFQAKPGILRDAGLAGVKWFGLVPQPSEGEPSLHSTILVSDVRTGRLLAIVAGDWITAKRTAAMSAIAARRFARPASASIAFIGAGVQGAAHLEALPRVLPRLRRAVVCSRTAASATRLADAARRAGFTASTTDDPRAAVEGADIVVTSVPEGAWRGALLEPAWLQPGAFVAAVDLARSWNRDTLRDFDLLATDDHEQSRTLAAEGRMSYAGPYDADLSDLCGGGAVERTCDTQRVLFSFSGHALADLAAAQVALQAARTAGRGLRLPG